MKPGTTVLLPNYRLKVSRYDRVSGMMLALAILLGSAVLLLFLYWLTVAVFNNQPITNIELANLGDGDDGLAGGMEIEGPLEEEIGQESDLEDPAIENTLAAIADAVGQQAALLENPALTDQMMSGKGGGSRGDGRGIGSGSGSGSGRGVKWEVRWIEGKSLQTYARQLDFFEIVLGAVRPGGRITCVSGLSTSNPEIEERRTEDMQEQLYLTWRSGTLATADHELLAGVGVTSADAPIIFIVKFVPGPLESQMVQLERARAGTDADRVRKTIFCVDPDGTGFKMQVQNQTYR